MMHTAATAAAGSRCTPLGTRMVTMSVHASSLASLVLHSSGFSAAARRSSCYRACRSSLVVLCNERAAEGQQAGGSQPACRQLPGSLHVGSL
jgi:hypothetical protein